MMRGIIALSVAVASLVARQSLDSGARDDFAQRYGCPPDRVTVKERTDLDPATTLDHTATPKPPAEVAADPGRTPREVERGSALRAPRRQRKYT